MEEPVSISEMVARAVNAGLTSPQPKRRRRRAAREAEERARRISRSSEDSDFEDLLLSDSLCDHMYHHNKELSQHVFNVFTQDTIETQERKVNVTTAICVRDCAMKPDEIEKWTKQSKPVQSKAPKRKLVVDKKLSTRDVELDMILAETVEEMKRYL